MNYIVDRLAILLTGDSVDWPGNTDVRVLGRLRRRIRRVNVYTGIDPVACDTGIDLIA